MLWSLTPGAVLIMSSLPSLPPLPLPPLAQPPLQPQPAALPSEAALMTSAWPPDPPLPPLPPEPEPPLPPPPLPPEPPEVGGVSDGNGVTVRGLTGPRPLDSKTGVAGATAEE